MLVEKLSTTIEAQVVGDQNLIWAFVCFFFFSGSYCVVPQLMFLFVLLIRSVRTGWNMKCVWFFLLIFASINVCES